MNFSDLSAFSKVAVGLAMAGFLVSFTVTESASFGGTATCSFTDYGKLVLGGLAVTVGGLGEVGALRDAATRNVNLIASGGASMVGILHILMGLGVVGGPC